jgi:signal transduction histidine kinase
LFWAAYEGEWLCARHEQGNEQYIAYYSLDQLHSIVRTELRARRTPDYFGISMELAGRPVLLDSNLSYRLLVPLGKAAGIGVRATPGLAPPPIFARHVKSEHGNEFLRLNVHLLSPELLFERQRARRIGFGLLIAAAGVISIGGYYATWRALRRQERLNEMKTNFVSSVSHELRAPIASVRLMAEGLEAGRVADNGKQQQYFRFIVQECRRLSAMIENVLDFSRIEQNRKRYELEETNLLAVVEQTVSVMQPYADAKRISLERTQSGTPCPVRIDGRAIQQALVNLIDNALKHSPDGGVVTIGVNFGDSTVELWVEDRGPGIPREEQERIFERFYRRGSELRRETQGVGIGLSIVKHILEGHDGTVRVVSEPGKGSRFVLELPLCGQPQSKEESA